MGRRIDEENRGDYQCGVRPMSEIKDKMSKSSHQDWAVLPFDESEDDERWARLVREIECLEKEEFFGEPARAARLIEFQHGPLLSGGEGEELF
jgi:hypothetical protein